MRIITRTLKYCWYTYKNFIKTATGGTVENGGYDVVYWRERLFTSFVTYLLPISIIALAPGVIISIKEGYIFIAWFDVFVPASIAVVTLNTRFNLILRKVFVVFILYCLAIMLMVYLGLFGPGVLYLITLSVFITLAFPRRYAYASVILNLLLCVGCAMVIHFQLFNSPLIKQYELGAWIAVSSNLIFLSWVSVMLIGNAISSLENIIIKEALWKKKLQQDADEKISSNKRLKESEVHYKSLFYSNPSPMWVIDRESLKFLQVNEAAVQKYGYTNDEFWAMTINDVKMEEDMNALHTDLKTNLDTGTPLNITTRHRSKSGEVFNVEVRFNFFTFKGKDTSLAIVRDITQQMNHISKIQTQNGKLREIAYIQSHHVRAPLARILGLVHLISLAVNDEKTLDLVHYLDRSAQDLDDVIKEITSNTEQVY